MKRILFLFAFFSVAVKAEPELRLFNIYCAKEAIRQGDIGFFEKNKRSIGRLGIKEKLELLATCKRIENNDSGELSKIDWINIYIKTFSISLFSSALMLGPVVLLPECYKTVEKCCLNFKTIIAMIAITVSGLSIYGGTRLFSKVINVANKRFNLKNKLHRIENIILEDVPETNICSIHQ